MTDFLESVLNSMSSAFNSSPTPADGISVIDLNLNEDKTLKWRSLYNNSNALKSNKKSVNNQNLNNNCDEEEYHENQQQQQQQQQLEKINAANSSYRENKMSQGQDNISNNEIITNNCKNDYNDKEKVINAITTNNTVNMSANHRQHQHKKHFNENVIKKKNQNKKITATTTTRRKKNLQSKIKKPLENSISASRRTRRSNPLEKSSSKSEIINSSSSNSKSNKRMNATVATDNKIIEPKRRGRSKKLTEDQKQNNSPKKLQNINKTTNSEDDKATLSPNKITSEMMTTSLSLSPNEINKNSGSGRHQSPNSGRHQSPNSGRQQSPTGKKLRRSERNSIPDEIKIEESETKIPIPTTSLKTSSNNQNLDGVDDTIAEPKGKRIRRSERLESRYEAAEENGNKCSSITPIIHETIEIKEEQKKIPEIEIPSLNDKEENEKKQNQQVLKPPSISIVETTPKRRGRRTKIITPEKFVPSELNSSVTTNKKSRNFKENADVISPNTRKEKNLEPPTPTAISQRPLRRIKPTVKILENEELRYEFETKNIARMTACVDLTSTISLSTTTTVTAAATTTTPGAVTSSLTSSTSFETSLPLSLSSSVYGNKIKKEQKEDLSQKEIQSKVSISPLSSSTSSTSTSKDYFSKPILPPTPPQSQLQSFSSSTTVSDEVKRKLFQPVKNNLNVDNIYPASLHRPCPDPETFLNEIKAAKINLHKSPENKKLNRKQHRKLLKQKLKHFEKLGLRRSAKDDRTETEESSSDNEEFLPPKKLNVGKPNVTLRLRNKESSPVSNISKSCQKIQKKRNNSRLSSSSNGGGGSSSNGRAGKQSTHITVTTTDEQIPPVNTLHKDVKKEQLMICLCQKPSQYYTRNTPETAFCCAIDSIEDEKVGCCNQLNGELLNLLRPSYRVGYMILCDDHKKRLLAHNCCASCGIFCTQGKFILCKKEHFFHADCAQKYILNTPFDPTNTVMTYPSPILVLKCPHCGCDTPEKTSLVTMKCNSLPVFLPSQKALIKPAKMSIPEGELIAERTRRRFPSVIEMDKLIPESVMNIASQRQIGGNNCVVDASNNGNEFTSKDMFYAINNDDLERVAEIIASGYDITSKMPEFLDGTCLHLVAHFGTVQMAYLLLCRESSEYFLNMIDKELRTPAMCAVIGDKCDILKLFIQFGADLSLKGSDGMTCLHMAAKFGSIAAAQLIIESYKNCTSIMNLKKFINAQDDGGWTAMVWAAENGFTDIVSYLISHGADSNVCDTENNTVLHWATLSNRIDTIMLLLQANVNCNQQNINGDTALHIACRQSSTRVCLMLIANGSDLVIKNKANELPYDCIPNEESQCARAVGFNMQMRSFGATGLRNKVICSDISNGREIHPIQAVRADKIIKSKNDQDDEIMLSDFKYITKSILLQNSIQIDQRVSQMRICSCNDGCNTDQCQCSTISVQNWYTPEGRLNNEFCFDDPPMIFECNDVCGCNKLICKNRVVQNGIKIPLQVFECEERLKGWGVRSLIQIPRGTFISEYTGEILTDIEADRRTDDSYFFDLGASDHCIDANYYGNISRFFNHSCTPNIVPVRVYYDHQDYRFPKIAFFACKDIMAGEELSFDYGDKFWVVKQKYFSCQCKSTNCRFSNNKISNSNENPIIISNINNNSTNAIPVTG